MATPVRALSESDALTILSGQSLSDALDLKGRILTGVFLPAAWTAAQAAPQAPAEAPSAAEEEVDPASIEAEQHAIERHHQIDPRRAEQSSTDLASVTVIGRSGWLAEAHATSALLSGVHDVVDYLDHHELSGIAVALDGHILATADLSVAALSQDVMI